MDALFASARLASARRLIRPEDARWKTGIGPQG